MFALIQANPLPLDERIAIMPAQSTLLAPARLIELAKAPILIRQVDATPSFEIIVRRSFADYLWLWLEDAASEYPFAIEAATSTRARLEAQVG